MKKKKSETKYLFRVRKSCFEIFPKTTCLSWAICLKVTKECFSLLLRIKSPVVSLVVPPPLLCLLHTAKTDMSREKDLSRFSYLTLGRLGRQPAWRRSRVCVGGCGAAKLEEILKIFVQRELTNTLTCLAMLLLHHPILHSYILKA